MVEKLVNSLDGKSKKCQILYKNCVQIAKQKRENKKQSAYTYPRAI